jgi:hypothetical protein
MYCGPQDSFFGAEVAAVRFLERNGYDVRYQGGVDTAQQGVANCRVFLSVGHDEYWSGDQRANVEAALAQGVNLCFWSGNECYWRTRWEPDQNGETYRTLVCYKESYAGTKIDPSPEWTGAWMDNSVVPGVVPQNALIGQLFRVDDSATLAIQIPYPLTNHPIWANTQIANTPANSTYTTAVGYLGYEWDIPEQNGHEPDVTLLSQSGYTVNTFVADFSGSYAPPQMATHSLTLYTAPSGALVFGAGTVFWSWALDDFHDNSKGPGTPVPADPNIQIAMMNLLSMMGVQAQTPQVISVQLAAVNTVPLMLKAPPLVRPSIERRLHPAKE